MAPKVEKKETAAIEIRAAGIRAKMDLDRMKLRVLLAKMKPEEKTAYEEILTAAEEASA